MCCCMKPKKKKVCVFRVTLPYLIFLVKPSNFFLVFSKKKKKKIDVSGINHKLNTWTRKAEQTMLDPDQTAPKGAV